MEIKHLVCMRMDCEINGAVKSLISSHRIITLRIVLFDICAAVDAFVFPAVGVTWIKFSSLVAIAKVQTFLISIS